MPKRAGPVSVIVEAASNGEFQEKREAFRESVQPSLEIDPEDIEF